MRSIQYLSVFSASILIATSLIVTGCQPGDSAPPSATSAPAVTAPVETPATPTTEPIPLPALAWEPGSFYFNDGGRPVFLFSRNLAGYEIPQYEQELELMPPGGHQFVRLSLDSTGTGVRPDGKLDVLWASRWERVFDAARERGIYVLPVFTSWYDWNNGSPDIGYSTWDKNTFNSINGGLAATPAELFLVGSPTQEAWLGWMQALVERWQGRENILAWEIFSEVNLATGADESSATAFVEKAAGMIRTADAHHRPVTASLAGVGEWPVFLQNDAIDLVNIHPYPPSAQLDSFIIQTTRQSLGTHHKPVLIGESGLSAATPDSAAGSITVAENAPTGIRHAIWAGVVSGAMNGRALWWEDGVAIYFPGLGFPFMEKYSQAELAASAFVQDVDFSGFTPLEGRSPAGVTGAALGNDTLVLGWYRDTSCEPPDWPLQPVIQGQTVTITVPGSSADWQVEFHDTMSGKPFGDPVLLTRQGSQVTVPLPDFTDAIAFKLFVSAVP